MKVQGCYNNDSCITTVLMYHVHLCTVSDISFFENHRHIRAKIVSSSNGMLIYQTRGYETPLLSSAAAQG